MMKKLVLSTVAVMFLLFASVSAQPGSGRGMHKGMMGGNSMMGVNGMNKIPGFRFYKMFESDLKLSDNQINQMKDIDYKFNNDMIDIKAKAQHAELNMKDEATKTDINKKDMLAKQDKLSSVKAKIANRVLSYKIDLYNVLTNNQKELLKTMRTKLMQEHKGMRKCKGMGNKGNGNGGNSRMRSRGMMK